MNNETITIESIAPVIIISGDDYYLMKERIDSIISLLPMGINCIDFVPVGDSDNLSDLLFECHNLPFMSDKRIVYLAGRTNALLVEDKKAMDKYIKEPSISTLLLILDNHKVFKDYYKKIEHIELNRLNINRVVDRINDLAQSYNVKIDRNASYLLAEYTDRYMSRADIELRKIVSYVLDKGIITIDDIKECVHPESEYQIYQFINAVVKGEGNKAIELSYKLLGSGTPSIVLLSALINQYRKLLHIALIGDRKTDKEIAELLKAPLFAIAKDREMLKNYPQMLLKRIIDKLYDLEISFKSGKITEEQALKTAIAIVLCRGGK